MIKLPLFGEELPWGGGVGDKYLEMLINSGEREMCIGDRQRFLVAVSSTKKSSQGRKVVYPGWGFVHSGGNS